MFDIAINYPRAEPGDPDTWSMDGVNFLSNTHARGYFYFQHGIPIMTGRIRLPMKFCNWWMGEGVFKNWWWRRASYWDDRREDNESRM